MAEPAAPLDEPLWLSPEEFRQYLENMAQSQMGMSLDEFIALKDAGKLPDTSVAMSLAILVGGRAR
jgi:hypothetical protein